MEGSHKAAQTALQAALGLVTDKDWLLSVKKTGQVIEFEAKFGDEMKTATLQEFRAMVGSSRHELTMSSLTHKNDRVAPQKS